MVRAVYTLTDDTTITILIPLVNVSIVLIINLIDPPESAASVIFLFFWPQDDKRNLAHSFIGSDGNWPATGCRACACVFQ